jgi:hypothetical protein
MSTPSKNSNTKKKNAPLNVRCKADHCKSCFFIHRVDTPLDDNGKCSVGACHDPNCRTTLAGVGIHGRYDHFCWGCGRNDCVDSLDRPCIPANICIACRAAKDPRVYCSHTFDECSLFSRNKETREMIQRASDAFRKKLLLKKQQTAEAAASSEEKAEEKIEAKAEAAEEKIEAKAEAAEEKIEAKAEAAASSEEKAEENNITLPQKIVAPKPKSVTFPGLSETLFPAALETLAAKADEEKLREQEIKKNRNFKTHQKERIKEKLRKLYLAENYDDSDNGDDNIDPENVAVEARFESSLQKMRDEQSAAAAASSSKTKIDPSDILLPDEDKKERQIQVCHNGVMMWIPESQMSTFMWHHQQQTNQALQLQQQQLQMMQMMSQMMRWYPGQQ